MNTQSMPMQHTVHDIGFIERTYFGGVILLALLLGGGTTQNLWTDHLLQLLLMPALVIGVIRFKLANISLAPVLVVFACCLFLFVQFLPIHSSVDIPGLSTDETTFNYWTATPSRALESALFAIAGLGFFIYVTSLQTNHQLNLIKFVFLGVVIQSLVGIIQLSYSGKFAGNTFLPFTFHSGLFANENHFSSLMIMIIPLLGFRHLVVSRNLILFLVFSVLVCGILFAVGSRAGMLLGICQLVLCLIWFYTRSVALRWKVLALSGAVILLIPIALFSGITIEQAMGIRAEFFANTYKAFSDFWLFGTGLGSFIVIYPIYEPFEQLARTYVNHAHNDYLELMLELGILVILPIIVFAVCMAKVLITSKEFGILAIAPLAAMVHSGVDYPLRTFAILMVFCLIASILLSKRPSNDAKQFVKTYGRNYKNIR